MYIRNSERASVFESRTAESSCGNVQKTGSDLSSWVLGAGCFIHMSGGWAEWSEDLDCHQSACTWLLHVSWASHRVAAGSQRKHLEKDCSMRLRQKLQGFFSTRLRNHAVTPPLHCFGYKWVANVGLSSKGGKLNSTSWWASGSVRWEIVLWAIFRK